MRHSFDPHLPSRVRKIPWRRGRLPTPVFLGFPGGSGGNESACNVGDLGLIPELGRSPWEGKGYTLQFSWASLVAQLVKNPPAVQETWVQSLGWEDPLEEGMATHSTILAWRIPMERGTCWTTVHGVTKSWNITEWLSTAEHEIISFNHILQVNWAQRKIIGLRSHI